MESTKPSRITIKDFLGRNISLADSPESWEVIAPAYANRENLLILGLGPGNPANLNFVSGYPWKKIFWFDEHGFLNSMNESQPDRLAKFLDLGAQKLSLRETLRVAPDCGIFFYRPAMRINPVFWGPILAQVEIASRNQHRCLPSSITQSAESAWLPGSESQLLHKELRFVLMRSGYKTIHEASTKTPTVTALENLWNGQLPDIAISVNFRGLDTEGRIFNLCNALGVPVAIWLVDNPYNLLSGIKLPWWKDASLFVTDPSFIQHLQKLGAKNVWHCPLAVAPHMWRNPAQIFEKPVFAGRSAFPGKKSYFSGINFDDQANKAAKELLEKGGLPDFHWWSTYYGGVGWPDKLSRLAAFGADCHSAQNRARWLAAAIPYGLRIIGDDGWNDYLPGVSIFPPVDYYGRLQELYQKAECVLNVTSLLLPHSLNQRHFDVWAAGSLLLTDSTHGLDIFPGELTHPVAMSEPGEFADRLNYFRDRPALRQDLIEAWRKELAINHTYAHRLEYMKQHIKKGAPKDAF